MVGEEAGGVEGRPGERDGGEGVEGDKRFRDDCEEGVQH